MGIEGSRVSRNLYRIDDLLLRAGGWAAALTLGGAAVAVLVGLAQGSEGPGDPGLAMLSRYALPLSTALLCSAALLTSGFAMRRREKQALSFWKLIDRSVEIQVPELVANSDFTREDLERNVRLLNNKALGFYVWDRQSDVIRDGRLESVYLHVEKCDVCHASIALQVPASLREIPLCSYCGDPVSIDRLQEQKRATLARMRADAEPARAEEAVRGGDAFSILLFLVLLVSFWPAALVYAWYKWQS